MPFEPPKTLASVAVIAAQLTTGTERSHADTGMAFLVHGGGDVDMVQQNGDAASRDAGPYDAPRSVILRGAAGCVEPDGRDPPLP